MSVKHNIAANYFGQAWTAVMGIIFVPLYIRFVGIEAYGLIGAFAVLQVWLSLLDFGLTPTLTREMARPVITAEDANRIWNLLRSVEIVVGTGASVILMGLWAGSHWLSTSWLHSRTLPSHTILVACLLMAVVAASSFLQNVYQGSLVGLQKQVALNITTSMMATVRGAGAIAVLVFVSRTVEAFFMWQVFVSLVTTAVFAIMVYRGMPSRTAPPEFQWASLRAVRNLSIGTFGISLLGFMISQSDKVVLSKALNLGEFGQYTLAAALAAYVRLLATSIDQAVYPKFVDLYARDRIAELAEFYHRATQLAVVLMGGVGVGLGLFGDHFLLAWTRDAGLARAVYPIFWVLLIGYVMNGLMNGPYYLMMAAGWTSMMLKVNIVTVVWFVPALLWLVHRYGAMGAAASWLAVNAVYLVVTISLMHRRLLPAEKWRWYLEDLAMPLASSAACGLLVRAALAGSPHDPINSGLIFAAGCAATVVGAAAAAPHTRHLVTDALARVRQYA